METRLPVERFNKKLLVNLESGLKGLHSTQVLGIFQVLKKLQTKREEHSKIWFINILKIFKSVNNHIPVNKM